MKAYTSEEFISSAGTIMSPVVLMLSGIGPKKHLRKWEIRCEVDLPVGRHLIDIFVQLFFTFDPISQEISPTQQLEKFFHMGAHNTGQLTQVSVMKTFLSILNSSFPDTRLLYTATYPINSPDFTKYVNRGFIADIKNSLNADKEKYIAIERVIMIMIKPKSRG